MEIKVVIPVMIKFIGQLAPYKASALLKFDYPWMEYQYIARLPTPSSFGTHSYYPG